MAVTSPAQRKKKSREGAATPVALVPFGACAHEHVEPIFDVTVTPGASVQSLNIPEVPSFGFLRGLWLEFEFSGGVLGSGVLAADYPFNVIESLSFSDVNGAAIFGPLSGYQAFLANLFGGYDFYQDPRVSPDYVGTINARFALRVPVEIHHNTGLGAIGNQNAAAGYRMALRIADTGPLFTTDPTTVAAVRVRGYLEAWTLPDATDRAGRPQAQLPPLHGTTQFWSPQTVDVSAGAASSRLTRMGNLLRTVVAEFRGTDDGLRDNAAIPDEVGLWWDERVLIQEHKRYRRDRMAHQYLVTPAGLPTGVLAWSFDSDVLGHAGDGTPELWLPTMQSTRFELRGTYAEAARVTVLTNDVAPVESDPARRYVETSETGFEPRT